MASESAAWLDDIIRWTTRALLAIASGLVLVAAALIFLLAWMYARAV